MNIIKPSTAGYTAAFSIVYGCFYFSLTTNSISNNYQFLLMIFITFLLMLLHEFYFNPFLFHTDKQSFFNHSKYKYKTNIYKSAFYRYLSFLFLSFLPVAVINNHYFFNVPIFYTSALLYNFIFFSILILGYPYILFTLKHKGSSRFEFVDYSILLLCFFRSLLFKYYYNIPYHFLTNRRFKKLLLVMIVNFFFLSLMVRFGFSQFNSFSTSLNFLISNFSDLTFFKFYHAVYMVLYHLLFSIDIGVAIIAYSVASRWLDNRTRSVDGTLFGWVFALMCYPPFSNSFSASFISYGFAYDPSFVIPEFVLMIAMFIIICCYSIYICATCTLGFKFSNLTNRGIVDHGVYSFVRHPAYLTKNLAWWIDNLYLFTNFWGACAMLCGNFVYFMRAHTEELHLMKDINYINYQKKVKYKFIPFIY